MKFITKMGLAVSTIGLALFTANGLNQKLVIKHYKYQHPNVNNGVRAAVITDLHSNLIGEDQATLMSLIDNEFPDVVFLVGDIVDENLPQSHAELFLDQIVAKYPTYYVTGNHEAYTKRGEQVKQMIEAKGIEVLAQESSLFTYNETTLQITGIDDPTFLSPDIALFEAMHNHQSGPYVNVLLAHRPDLIEEYLAYPFDIIFSGHAHGGQWRIPGLMNGLYAPHQGLFPKYAGGEYNFNQTKLIVSRGLENQKLDHIPRFYNRPEVVIVDFLPIEE
ncbi:metallophosphoesterase [Globicatella sanguinis]|uniref:metallophosphoesterase n=1 Tax=Globicatella sanguinis TaxID=13076 RepID=UPI002543D148|nr:metallophosphoesterase [Globicatella sanguinis]MDK7630308.1 metallophosphoesterase [Globicatella sanguinis]WIK66078.1 metallophosphoesterase [Globicatella sanguinis]WKT55483.1 metallophosphoesterase [Globicatella sanguinis]